MTSHGAQGVTCDKVFVAGVMSRQGLYVSASRGRESAAFYTPDKETFLESAGVRSEERESALEFAREAELEQAMGANRLTLLRAVIEAGAGDYRALAAAFMRQAVEYASRTLKRERKDSLKLKL